MERETMLTNKIRTIELKPVPWKKAEVWFMIHEQISTNPKSFRFYYYAAAVIFFMFFNIYQLQQTRIESVTTNNKQSTISSAQNLPAHGNLDQDEIATQSNYTRKKSQSRVVVQPSEVLVSDLELVDVDIQLTPEEVIINSAEAIAMTQRVEPIVGVIQPVNDVASVKSKRKKLFHKLEPAEKEFEVGHPNTIIIARIK